ncbi:hypothetical protein, conserved [Eimeria tenella]|uniref:Uncharacterized protein n=1 Tax=Eimeria tenella TaxID=5802 RepID=U6KYW4_EIMTE|nr:hypothetical protein, conserved [Eimeria tenella]CDJ42123.1 hypothetical protein, conserved [Eimeria tenella]|eukprot:XP_013232873.1 hypothetical protein, conserved [Eimeria tenella]
MTQQAPQSFFGEPGFSETADLYEEAIQATISQCQLLQNAKVLAAIEKQWRQSLRRKQIELSRAAAARQDAASTAAATSEPQAGASASNATEAQSSTGVPSAQSAEASTGTAALSTESGEQKQTEAEAEESDDDFADADIDEAGEGVNALGQRLAAGAGETNGAARGVGGASAHQEVNKDVQEKQQHQQQSNCDNSTALDESDDDQEEGAHLTVDDVSDLDDAEPQTTDGIFAFFEKVERAAAGSSRRCSKWKVVLRHGILRIILLPRPFSLVAYDDCADAESDWLQVGGREIPFDKTTGEFSF